MRFVLRAQHQLSGDILSQVRKRARHIAASHHVSRPVPMGSHPATDGLFSSQRIRVIHDGGRFSRLDKVRDLVNWPTALAALRVCPAHPESGVNCGKCEKCLRTRLELLAAGIEETSAFGRSLTPIELWDESVPTPTSHRAIMYEDLLPALRARGLGALCRGLEERIAAYRERAASGGECGGYTMASEIATTSQR
jgi:hypothetical protein